ncbi:hypothetical protein RKV15_00150, partial [Streptococcus pneumoniae]|nr:hypothetical protein [Streptococcus pneumoniae]
IVELKNKVPTEAEDHDGNRLMYQFGATFTQKALMKADEILTQQARQNSQKVIFHITDGVPTMSYPINFNHATFAPSYQNQLN